MATASKRAIPGTESGRNQDADFRRTNSLLTEISNLSWGDLSLGLSGKMLRMNLSVFGQSFPALSIMSVAISALEAMMQSSALPILFGPADESRTSGTSAAPHFPSEVAAGPA